METNPQNPQKKRTKKVVLFSLGTLALGTLTFFGIKWYNKKKNNSNEDFQTNDSTDTEISVPPATLPKPRANVPATNVSTAFPLRIGSKGDKVRLLQNAFIRTYGAGILPKYGADGILGNEVQSALRSKGYGLPLSETDFNKITQEKNETQKPQTLLSFDPASIAKGIYSAILIKDFNSAITLLKTLKDTTTYSLVSEKLQEYRIGGVRKTLVTAMLGSFTESSQRSSIQTAFKNMGLKYDGSKWSI